MAFHKERREKKMNERHNIGQVIPQRFSSHAALLACNIFGVKRGSRPEGDDWCGICWTGNGVRRKRAQSFKRKIMQWPMFNLPFFALPLCSHLQPWGRTAEESIQVKAVWLIYLFWFGYLLYFHSPASSSLWRLLLLPARLFPQASERRAGAAAEGRRRPAAQPAAQSRQRRDSDGDGGSVSRSAGLGPGVLHSLRPVWPAKLEQTRAGPSGQSVVSAVVVAAGLHSGLRPASCAWALMHLTFNTC